MIVSLDKGYTTELRFLPARTGSGNLAGLEVIMHFVGTDDAVRIPTTLVTARLRAEDEVALFLEKMSFLESCQIFFLQHNLIAWINITPAIADALLNQHDLRERALRLTFLEFMVNECFLDSAVLNEAHPLVRLLNIFPLVLADFGAGNASMKAIYLGLFKRVVFDKNFIQRQAPLLSFAPFMRAITNQLKGNCESIMVTGVDDAALLAQLQPWGFSAMQGMLWPPVEIALLTTLVQK